MDLVERVRRAIETHALLESGEKVVVGVSGGPDSLALLHSLKALSPAFSLTLHVAHVHHGLRGDEADADADFVMALADEWGMPSSLRHADVLALVAERKLSVEEAARQARYTHLAGVAQAVGAGCIAVGHNADDQAETMLMHFLRGSGLAGLRGMRPRIPLSDYHLLNPIDVQLSLIRPLLSIPRAEIEAYCEANGLQPRFDRSNLDRTYFRNRLRQEVLPLLETLNPGVRDVLRRSAEVAAADYDVLAKQAERAWENCLLEDRGPEAVHFDLVRWRELPLALQRATLRKAVWHLRNSLRDVTFVQVNDAVRVAAGGDTGSQATLPAGLSLRVGYEALVVCGEGYRPQSPDEPLLAPGQHLTLAVPGAVDLPGGWRLSIGLYEGRRDGPQWEALLAERWAAPLDAGTLGTRLTLRTRQPGDRFQPQGMDGHQKVAHFMVNAKIDGRLRDRVPLLVAGDAIVWLVGWRVDRRFVVGPATQRVVVARFEREEA